MTKQFIQLQFLHKISHLMVELRNNSLYTGTKALSSHSRTYRVCDHELTQSIVRKWIKCRVDRHPRPLPSFRHTVSRSRHFALNTWRTISLDCDRDVRNCLLFLSNFKKKTHFESELLLFLNLFLEF